MLAVGEVIRVLVERDALEEAEEVLEQLADPRASRSVEVARFLFARGRLRGAQGRLQEALDDFLECGQRCARARAPDAKRRAVARRGGAGPRGAWQPGRGAAARGRAARAGARVRAPADAGDLAARVRAGRGRRAAVLSCSRRRSRRWSARSHRLSSPARYPITAPRCGAPAAASKRAPSSSGRSISPIVCGARRIANQARAELIAAGAKPRRDAITGRDALTAGELRVARLAAEGLTNREIAQALFITTKTAKAHLSRVYRKLEITRRGQLANALTSLLGNYADSSATATAVS